MKKKFLALAVASAMLMSATPAFAADHVVIAPSASAPEKEKMSAEELKKKAVELGIIDENMDISKGIMVETACYIAWRASGSPEAKNGFIAPCAVNAPKERQTAIKWAVGKGIISGSEDIKAMANGFKLTEIALRADFDVDMVPSRPNLEAFLRFIIELGQRELEDVGNGMDSAYRPVVSEPPAV